MKLECGDDAEKEGALSLPCTRDVRLNALTCSIDVLVNSITTERFSQVFLFVRTNNALMEANAFLSPAGMK